MEKSQKNREKMVVESIVETVHIFLEYLKSYPQGKNLKIYAKTRPKSINSLSTTFSQVIVD